MDDLIGRLVANAGVDRTDAEKAVGIVSQFPLEEGLAEYVRVRIGCMLGADAALPASCPGSISLRMFGAKGLMGFGVGEVEAVARGGLSFAREIQGKTQSAGSSARFPASASSSDA
jgi:hypothetical protein